MKLRKIPSILYKQKVLKFLPLLTLAALAALSFFYLLFLIYYQGKIFPGVKIANQNFGGYSPALAQATLAENFHNRASTPLRLSYQGQDFALSLSSSAPRLNLEDKVEAAYELGRSNNLLENFLEQMKALLLGMDLTPQLGYDNKETLEVQLKTINQTIKKASVNAQLKVEGEQINLISSQEGSQIDQETLLKNIGSYLNLTQNPPTQIPTKVISPLVATNDVKTTAQALEKIKTNPLQLHYQDLIWTIDFPTLLSLLDLNGSDSAYIPLGFNSQQIITNEQKILFSQSKLGSFLQKISAKIDQPVQEARFGVDQDSTPIRVSEFQPSQEGRILDTAQTEEKIVQALSGGSTNIDLPVEVIKPKITTGNINGFGINQLIGQGVSNFARSIENRIYNIKLAASRINGVLITPGDTFSFNQTVGEVSAASGYKQAYVIESGKTVLGDGGGVCQVSTTLFRATLNSGLPVVARTAHAYRVGYYEQGFPPGLDATVYAPNVDFKFKNDTPAYILIQAYAVETTLYVNIYGTSDGRVATISTPIVTSQTPPPPDLRQDDPTLAKGEVKQVDFSAWGANVTFTRKVTRGQDVLINETYRSNYRPWQAIYLVGTK